MMSLAIVILAAQVIAPEDRIAAVLKNAGKMYGFEASHRRDSRAATARLGIDAFRTHTAH